MNAERVRLDRGWIGATEAGAWANPAVCLFVAGYGLLAAGSVGYLAGTLPTALVVPRNAVAIYLCFTVMHEGVHRVAHRDPPCNDALASRTFATLFVVWLGPALLAVLLLAFAFDFLPHYPYDTAERWFDTRIYPGRVQFAVVLGQNYHLIHHLWTTIPWSR